MYTNKVPTTFYIGCFNDEGYYGDAERDLDFNNYMPQVTIESCIDSCKSREYTFAGVQDG